MKKTTKLLLLSSALVGAVITTKAAASTKYIDINDKLIEKIVEARPQTLDELRNIKGIDPKIIDKHGLKIIKIVKNNS